MAWTATERQARYRQKKYAQLDNLPKIQCACGCGELIPPINRQGKSAQFKHGHNPHGLNTRFYGGQRAWNRGLKVGLLYPNSNRGKVFPPEMSIKRTATRLANNGGVYCIKSGWKQKPLTLALMARINREKALRGGDNPAWLGGKSLEKYGIEFNDNLKRQIKERDGRCVGCGASGENRRLVVHHIDFNKKNNAPSNLQTLCVSCHGRLHGRVSQNLRVVSGVM